MGMASAAFSAAVKSAARTAVEDLQKRLERLLCEVVNDIPASREKKSQDPEAAARTLASGAARDASLLTGALALPRGPLGLITILPDLVAVWRRQAQLVADIAGLYGRSDALTREVLMYCLFQHVAGDAVRDILVRAGHRVIVARATAVMIYRIAGAVAGALIQRLTGRFLVSWVPVLGAVGVAAYTYRDTQRVAETAISVFGAMKGTEAKGRKPKK